MDILSNDQILNMYDRLGASIAMIDRDMKLVYLNQAAQELYSRLFGERNYLGYSTRECHSKVNQDNIDALFLMFGMGKKLNFYHLKSDKAEGGEVTVMQFPYIVDGKVEGIIEINIESSLVHGGHGEHRRVYTETDESLG